MFSRSYTTCFPGKMPNCFRGAVQRLSLSRGAVQCTHHVPKLFLWTIMIVVYILLLHKLSHFQTCTLRHDGFAMYTSFSIFAISHTCYAIQAIYVPINQGFMFTYISRFRKYKIPTKKRAIPRFHFTRMRTFLELPH